ncbi:titin homolog isoform X1 [Lytechinus pictus]|uniref:titin homolog isoform X1 n=2 Tax=Lytechinus pictus TaxID=7653 RepID=UPI0030B9EA4B
MQRNGRRRERSCGSHDGDTETQCLQSFDSLYTNLFGSSDRQNFNGNSTSTPSANESLYPSSPYQQHQMHSAGLGQTLNGLSYPSHSTDKWNSSRPSAMPPQHSKEPYSIGPFNSIWSMKSNEMAGAGEGGQRQKKASDWSSENTAASEYHNTQARVPTTNGLPFGGYDQQVHGNDDVGFHGDVGGVNRPGYPWSPCDGVNDGNNSGLPDWHWNQGKYWQPGGPEMVGNMMNPAVNEWELQDDELARKNQEEDMKGREERRKWKKKGLNYHEFVPGKSVHKQRTHSNDQTKACNEKVVASFLEKYRDKDPESLTSQSSIDSNEYIEACTVDEVRDPCYVTQVAEEFGPACGDSQQTLVGQPSVSAQGTGGESHTPTDVPLPDPERCDPTGDHQETTSNIDSSDLVDQIGGREVRSLSDPVTVQEVQQSNSVKNGSGSRKALSNGKIRPGKRKPKLPRDKRRIIAQAEKSESVSSPRQTIQNKTQEQSAGIPVDKKADLITKVAGSLPKQSSSKSLKNKSSEHIVQSSKSAEKKSPKSKCIQDSTGESSLSASKAHTVKSSSQQVQSEKCTLVSQSSCLECSIRDDCDRATSDNKSAPSSKVFQSAQVEEDLGTKDSTSCDLSCGKTKANNTLKINHKSSTSLAKNVSSACVDDPSSGNKNVSNGIGQGTMSAGTENIQEQITQPPLPKEVKNNSSDCTREVKDSAVGKSKNIRTDVGDLGMGSTPVHNQKPSCKPDRNGSLKNLKQTDELKSGKSSKVPTTDNSSTSISNACPSPSSGIPCGQEKASSKESNLFFDPKRIFRGQKSVKTETKKQDKEAEKSTLPMSASTIPKNSHSNDSLNSQSKRTDLAHRAESEQCSKLHVSPTESVNPKESVRNNTNEGMANGTVPSKDLPPPPVQTVPSSSAKDALASKASAMKTDSTASQHLGEPPKQPTSPADPRPSRMYSYKKDDKTGLLRRSSDPKVEETTKNQSQRRDSSGTQSSSDEGKGERRCSGDSHMDGFHHPFGCSAQCYSRRSSSPSSSRSSSNSRSTASGVNQNAGSASAEKKSFPQMEQQNASPQNGRSTSEKVFDASAFEELREGLRNSWLSKEKEKQREDEKKRQEKAKKEHLEKVKQQEAHEQKRREEMQEKRKQQEKLEQMRQKEKQEQKKRQEETQSSASHPKRPTRATYSTPKFAEHGSKDKRSGAATDREGPGSSTQHPRRPWPGQSGERPRTPSQEGRTEDSDLEEDLARGFTDEWWFILGKKLCNGVAWFVLFTVLLCLVILSFLLAFLRDACKFAYHRGWDLWYWYRERPSKADDDFFNSHQRESSNNGGWFFGSGQQRETGAGTGSRSHTGGGAGSWSHTGASSSSSSQGFWGSGRQQEQGARAKKPRKKLTQNVDLPITEQAAIRRLLSCDPGSYYEVVGVAEDSSEEDIKRFYRKQCMLVHPDKTDQPQANEAFQILQKAYAILSDETKRGEYDMELNYKEHFEDKVNDLFKKMSEMQNIMPCAICKGSHKRYETDLPIHAARYCATHNSRHPVKDGDLWKETASLGFKIYVFLCDDQTVYDVTEWAACQNLDWVEANSCRLLCKVMRGSQGNRQRQHQSAGCEGVFDDIFGSGAFRQFQNSANQQGHHGHSHHGNGGGGGGGGGGHSHGQQGGGGRNKGMKKSRKKKK